MDGPQAVMARLVAATNAHDVEAVAACFTEDYANHTPAHPGRRFVGREQVRRNWHQIFAFVPDLHAQVLAEVVDGDSIWTEWHMTGTRGDGSRHDMRGVIIFGVTGDAVSQARFYLEPVDAADQPDTVDDAVRRQVVRG